MSKNKPQAILGIDTSCYTTSVNVLALDGTILENYQSILNVATGQRGLRQAEGVFQHVDNAEEAFKHLNKYSIVGVSCSEKPVNQDDSYMPVFKVGKNIGKAIAKALDVPFYSNSHQENHLAACLASAEVSFQGEYLVIHASGGTTDLLKCQINGLNNMNIFPLGISKDLHVGQLFDRIGVALGLGFPAGSEMEKLAQTAKTYTPISARVSGYYMNLSGAEKQAFDLIENNQPAEQVAMAIYKCISRAFERWILNAVKETGIKNIIVMGGVASSQIIRQELFNRVEKYQKAKIFFAKPQYSRDNAYGSALIGLSKYKMEGKEHGNNH